MQRVDADLTEGLMQTPVVHHVALSVSDVDRSSEWYLALLGPAQIIERTGPGWVRTRMQWSSGLVIGVTAHEAATGSPFDPSRIGLDHIGLSCQSESEVRAWHDELDRLGYVHGPVEDVPYGWAVTARDPDGIPVEFFCSKA